MQWIEASKKSVLGEPSSLKETGNVTDAKQSPVYSMGNRLIIKSTEVYRFSLPQELLI